MLALLPTAPWYAANISPEEKEAAATRKGVWQLETTELVPTSAWCGLTTRTGRETTSIRFTEKEWVAMLQVALQNTSAGSKPQVMLASLQATANRLWTRGTCEDVAMMTLAPPMVQRYVNGAMVSEPGGFFCCSRDRHWHTRLTRLDTAPQQAWSILGLFGQMPPEQEKTDGQSATSPIKLSSGSESSTSGRAETPGDAGANATKHVSPSGSATAATISSAAACAKMEPISGEPDSSHKPREDDGGAVSKETDEDVPDKDPEKVQSMSNKNREAVSRLRVPGVAAAIRPEDAEDYYTAEPHKRYRTVEIGGERVHVVLGQHFNKDVPQTHAPRVGVMMGPSANIPNVYSNCVANVDAAVTERWEKKSKPCKFTKADRTKVGKAVHYMLVNVYMEDKVHEWFERHFAGDLIAIKSRKWSDQRMQNALEQLLCKVDPAFVFKTAVKAEVMPESKAPRFLVADGDAGQVMALAVIKCIEDILFEKYEAHSIKHRHKAEAIKDLIKEWTPPKKCKDKGWSFIEGDGSAWDTTCNSEVRGCIENPIIEAVTRLLAAKYLQPESWGEAHLKSCTDKELKLLFKKGGEFYKRVISNIRRSGHRGTSVLNWIVNYVMWSCALCKDPRDMLAPAKRWTVDVAGQNRWVFMACEGDDSGGGTSPKLPQLLDEEFAEANDKGLSVNLVQRIAMRTGTLEKSAECMVLALQFWDRAGFNMKIFCREKTALFVGVQLAVTPDGPTGDWCPELARALKGNVACGARVLEAVKKGDLTTVKEIAAATALARAADFAGKVPSVSRKYLEYADSLSKRDYTEDEMSYRCCGELGMTTSAVRKEVEIKNGACSEAAQTALLAALGLSASDEELSRFESYPWSFGSLDDHDAFAAAMPRAWLA